MVCVKYYHTVLSFFNDIFSLDEFNSIGVAPNYAFLVTMRFVVGIGIGASSIPFDLLAEMLPIAQRGEYLMVINGFWTIGKLGF